MTEDSEAQVQQRQRLLVAGLIGAVVILVGSVLFFSGASEEEKVKSTEKTENIHIANARHAISPEREWLSNAELSLKQQSDQLKQLTEHMEQLRVQQETLKTENENLKAKIAVQPIEPVLGEDSAFDSVSGKPLGNGLFPGTPSPVLSQTTNTHNNWGGASPTGPVEPLLHKHQIALTPKPNSKTTWQEKSLQNYLPAGAYVKAVILSGVMASAAVKSQADPLPILFRITGPAVTANHQEVDVSGCTVTGEAYGDISSERAFVRLHDMTCSKNTDKVIETKVEGYAAALGTGIQGKVISREGELIQSSFWSGLFGGIGQATAQASTTVSTSPLGAVETIKGEDMAKNAIGKGLASSAERISKYHIERAEQYHAVIEIKAGREVELVFIKGVFLDGRPAEKAAEAKAG